MAFSPTPTDEVPIPRLADRHDLALHAREAMSDSVCFTVEGAPPGCSRSLQGPGAAMTLLTRVRGPVTAGWQDHELHLDHRGVDVRLRYLLPGGIVLGALEGQDIRVEVRHVLHSGRGPTADARLFTPGGELLLWARDGTLPGDGVLEEGAIRVACQPQGPPQLAVASRGELTTVPVGEVGELHEGAPLAVLPLRVRADDLAFVLLRA